MPIPLDTRKKPTEIKVNVSTGTGVDVKWSDGHASHYDFSYLRDQCPCALCNDERAKKAKSSQQGAAPVGQLSRTLSSAVLPMYKPKVTARSASAVGSYALQINFSDGHTAGIFSFEHLREICPCEACAHEFRA